MKPPLLIVVTILGLAAALTACGDAEEDVAPQPTGTVTTGPETSSPATPTVVSSPAAIPADWATHTDPVLGFSLRYPSDLIPRDLTGPSTVTGVESAFEFRSPIESLRGFTFQVSSNAEGVTPIAWLRDHAACLPGTFIDGTVAGQPAVFCTSEPAEIPEQAVAFLQMDKIVFMTSILPEAEFDLVVASLRR